MLKNYLSLNLMTENLLLKSLVMLFLHILFTNEMAKGFYLFTDLFIKLNLFTDV